MCLSSIFLPAQPSP
jgi:tRNA pseudouridine13 synthase